MLRQLKQLEKTNQSIATQRVMTSTNPEWFYMRKAIELANNKNKNGLKLVNKKKCIKKPNE